MSITQEVNDKQYIEKARIKPYTSKTQQFYVEGWKMCAKMNEFSMLGRRAELLEEVHKHYKRAKRYRFNKLAAEFASFLQFYYFNIKGDRQKGDKYAEQSLHFSQLSYLENVALVRFSAISIRLNQTRNPDESLISQLRNTCRDFKPYLKHDSALLWSTTYSLMNALAYLDNNTNLVIEQSYKVIKYMEERGIERSAHFWKDMAPALIIEGRYKEALTAINKAIKGINKGTLSWSVFVYYRVVIELHQGNYQTAHSIFLEAEKKRQINNAMRDTWNIIKGYMKFLIESGKVQGSSHFKVGKFLNDIEVFSSDKSGQNINIIILKIILRLQSNRSKIIDERESIQRYSERYLEEGSRARLFFLMLHQIASGDFQKEKVRIRAQKYLDLMPTQKGYDGDLEMVPFEQLWELVLEGLD